MARRKRRRRTLPPRRPTLRPRRRAPNAPPTRTSPSRRQPAASRTLALHPTRDTKRLRRPVGWSRRTRAKNHIPMEEFHRIRRLPPYVFEQVNRAKAIARNAGADIIDLGMGNPDLPAPAHVI